MIQSSLRPVDRFSNDGRGTMFSVIFRVRDDFRGSVSPLDDFGIG